MTDILRADLNLLKVLDVLLDECSVSLAAKRLHVTQPSVSYTLQKLRELFDDPLFIRAQRGLIPTARAEALRPSIKRLLNDAQTLIKPPEFRPDQAEFTFSVSANDYLQIALLAPFVKAVRALSPKLKIAIYDLSAEEATERMRRGELDLVLTFPQELAADFCSRQLFRDDYVGVVGRDHPLKSKSVSAKEFMRYEQVIVSPTGFAFEGPLYRGLLDSPVMQKIAVTSPSFAILPRLLAGGDLVAMIPRRLLAMIASDLREIHIAAEMPALDVIAAWHPRLDHDPAQQWVRDVLARVAAIN
ncbi:LysR family transcriptional regulator [Zhongshania sp.]|jgi:DNA-binding transcriptional LysR family regulator|uniref:LysR family transcriptional regulator n=1 Tax=Zhongshania sp. TaxID=1971902 RepID=UPI002A83B9CB|nr:LysR family transcriptional regulator [Zhongshania sp.]